MIAPTFGNQTPPPPWSTRVVDRVNFAIQFEKYRDIILKRWWIITVCLGVSLVWGGYKAYRQPDIYLAKGSMMVRPRVNIQGTDTVGEEAANFFGTQVRLMQSKLVVDAAKEKLQETMKGAPAPSVTLSVFQERNTSIFSFTATSPSPEYAQNFLDQVMREYIAYKKRLRDETSDSTASTLLREVERLDKERQKAESDLLDFQKENNMAYFEGQGNVAAQYLVDLKRRLADVKTEIDLLNTETAEQHLDRDWRGDGLNGSDEKSGPKEKNEDGEGLGHVPSPKNLKMQVDHTSIKNAIVLLRSEREDLLKSLRPKHPKIIRIDEEIERKERLLKIALQQSKQQIAAYRDSLLKQQEALEKSMADWDKQALEANQKASQYAILKSNLSRTKELYDVLVKQLQQIGLGKDVGQEVIAISEPAKASSAPVGPNRHRDMMLALLYGSLIALTIIYLLERFDDRVKTVEDLQDSLTETVLGQIPLISENVKGVGPLIMVDAPSHNSFSESFRNVRSSLRYSSSWERAKCIAITSAIPGDGKTTFSVNLALCLAQIEGGKTLLIDADMRKMNVHRYFKMQLGPGLSEVLSGQAEVDKVLLPTGFQNLDVLLAGATPPNPGDLILSENFKSLVAELGKKYHRIVIDTPPILATDDTLSLAPSVDGVIFIVKANQTSLRFINRSLGLLKQRGATILGIVLNQIDTTSAHYYYYYYYSNYYVSEEKRPKLKGRAETVVNTGPSASKESGVDL